MGCTNNADEAIGVYHTRVPGYGKARELLSHISFDGLVLLGDEVRSELLLDNLGSTPNYPFAAVMICPRSAPSQQLILGL
jgi:hypothetical protein